MKIKLEEGNACSPRVIAALESKLGTQLPKSFKDFLLTNDGAEPESNTFKIGDDNASGVRQFIPAKEIARERSEIEGFPATGYPIAFDSCGNYVGISIADGSVFFWDHELDEPPTRLAADFNEFLELLEPFHIDAEELDSIPVLRVWKHPDFDKIIKEAAKKS
jgi:hypothetical protein